MRMPRRRFLALSAAAAAAPAMGAPRARADDPPPAPFDLRAAFPDPVTIRAVEVLRNGDTFLLRATDVDGHAGLFAANDRIDVSLPMLLKRVVPYFAGKDARDLEALVDGVYAHQSNYKYAGLLFWNCVGWVELSLLDLLGRRAKKPVCDLLGGRRRDRIPVYMSSLRRDTTPAQEVEWLGRRVAETGARAVKLKIGGRMSRNADASPGRTEALVPLARRTFGDACTLYVDANSSYDAARAVEVGRMLEAHDVSFYEEPCPWEDLEATRQVAEALAVDVAGGEQDTSYPTFERMVKTRAVDIVQPDVTYNGGLLRTLRVARLAAAHGLRITPHSPKTGFLALPVLHFAACAPNAGPFMEWNAAGGKPEPWATGLTEPKSGEVALPPGPGLGAEIDPAFIARAQPLKQA